MTKRSQAAARILLASVVAGLMALPSANAQDKGGSEEKVHCYGINGCKGTGDCSGKGHQCAGMNACAGQGHINLPKDLCLRIKGGHLTPGAGEEG